jgi:hypothetical protein
VNYNRGLLLTELIAFGEAGCFGAADTTEFLGVDMRAEKALLGVWILGAADTSRGQRREERAGVIGAC